MLCGIRIFSVARVCGPGGLARQVRLRTPQLRDNVFFRGFDWKGLVLEARAWVHLVRIWRPLLRQDCKVFESLLPWFPRHGTRVFQNVSPLGAVCLSQVRGPRDLTNFRDCEHEDPQAMPYQVPGCKPCFG